MTPEQLADGLRGVQERLTALGGDAEAEIVGIAIEALELRERLGLETLRLGSEPAFPCVEVRGAGENPLVRHHPGVSKRELIAALIMAQLAELVDPGLDRAARAVKYADSLLEELTK